MTGTLPLQELKRQLNGPPKKFRHAFTNWTRLRVTSLFMTGATLTRNKDFFDHYGCPLPTSLEPDEIYEVRETGVQFAKK